MKGLLIVLFVLTCSAASAPTAPTDERALNEFADAYNSYVQQLREGKNDAKLWKRTADAWTRMTR